LAGQATEEQLKTFAGEDEDRRCQALFYAGFRALVDGDRKRAKQRFQACVQTKGANLSEFATALAELRRLE
jgi:hypothetical protein